MLRIAYCDDIKTDRDKIMSILSHIEEKWEEDFDIYSFTSGETLCESITKNHFDIILLDILMNGIDGIETATRIRAMGENNLIIFISSYDDRVKELFHFQTIAFIDKPLKTDKLEIALQKAYNIIKRDNNNFFTYNKNGKPQHIQIKNIVYFESHRNEIIVHTTKGNESFYDTLTSVWLKTQKTEQFIMSHRSFIFNLNFITLKSVKVVIKSTNETFNIGENYKADTQERYLKFIEKRWR